jgi:hypothetical protein
MTTPSCRFDVIVARHPQRRRLSPSLLAMRRFRGQLARMRTVSTANGVQTHTHSGKRGLRTASTMSLMASTTSSLYVKAITQTKTRISASRTAPR